MTRTAPQTGGDVVRSLEIVNKRGLHARASARFVQLASTFNADVQVEKDGLEVDGTSILDLMMLAASPGCRISVRTRGPEAQAAMEAIAALVADRFGEEC
ncbi:MAG: HPr family phosphocarrier protein [Notoacmeibacter sp.]|nr:HPr family phosphocarrier protein [Notoacmeibacter sp.]MCC0031623.1 HPr family phosphocarrier protein [Brucellaceae bacterium]